MITRAQIRRQLRAQGGIMNVAPREKFGLGSKIKDRFRKLIPNELADIAVKAAPFVAPFNPGIAGLMRGIGRFDQRGSISDALKQGLATTAFGAGSRALGGAENIMGGGLRGGFTNPIGEGRMQSMKDLFQGGKKADDIKPPGTDLTPPTKPKSIMRTMTDKVFKKVPFSDNLDQIVKEKLLVGGITAAGSYIYDQFIDSYPDPQPGEDMEKYLAERKERVGAQMRTYMDSYFANDPEYMALDDAGRNEFVSRYNVRDGGRIGYQTGGISMGNTLQQNIATNRGQATGIQAMLNEARKRAGLPAVQAAPMPTDGRLPPMDPNQPTTTVPLPSPPRNPSDNNKFSNSGGISILDDPRYESSISGPENTMPFMPVNSSPFPGRPSLPNIPKMPIRPMPTGPIEAPTGPVQPLEGSGVGPRIPRLPPALRDPITGGGQPIYSPGPGGISGPMPLPDLNNMTRPATLPGMQPGTPNDAPFLKDADGNRLPNIPKMPIRPMPIFSNPNLQDIKLQTSPGPMPLPDLGITGAMPRPPGPQLTGGGQPIYSPGPGGISGPMPLPDLGITGVMPRPPGPQLIGGNENLIKSPGLPPQNFGPGTSDFPAMMDPRGPTPEMLDAMEDGTFEEKFMGPPERPVPPTSGVDPINQMPLPDPGRPIPPTSGVSPINQMPMLPTDPGIGLTLPGYEENDEGRVNAPIPMPDRPITNLPGPQPIDQMPLPIPDPGFIEPPKNSPGFEGDPDLMPGAPDPMPDRPITNLPGAEPITNLPGAEPQPIDQMPMLPPAESPFPGTGAYTPPGSENIMGGFRDFMSENYGDGPGLSTADVRRYRLPDGTIQEGSSTSMSRVNEYLRSIGQPPATDVNTFSGGQLQQVQPGEPSLRTGTNTGGKFTDLQRPRDLSTDPNFANLSQQEQDASMEKFRKETDAYIKRFGSFADGREIDPRQGISAYRDILNAIQMDYPDIFKTLKGDETLAELDQKMLDEQQRSGAARGGRMGLMGGSMPMGIMRTNQAGVMERDYRNKGGFVPVGVKEKADDVPAMLSKNEFVFTADAVRGAGNGSIENGAQKMYDTMKNLERRVT